MVPEALPQSKIPTKNPQPARAGARQPDSPAQVLEGSRPRALQQLGLDAAEHVAAGTVWVAISAYGREQAHRVGFGDDVAAAVGLVVDDGDGPYPAGDAIADPLAGATAAAAATAALRGPGLPARCLDARCLSPCRPPGGGRRGRGAA